MCLAIPGQVIELVDEHNRLAEVDVAGVVRNVNVGLLDATARRRPGDWVLIHVGFALSKVDEDEAQATLRAAPADGRGLRAGARGPEGERDRMTALRATGGHCITCSDEGVPMRVLGRGAIGLASCVDDEGEDEVMTDLVGARRAGRRAARPRRRRAAAARRGVRHEVRRRVPRRGAGPRARGARSSPPSSRAATTR